MAVSEDQLNLVGSALQQLGAALSGMGGPSEPLMKAQEKAEGPEARTGDRKDTAENSPVPVEEPKEDPQSLFFDPFSVVEQLGYKDRPSQLSYGTLKAMAYKTPVIHSVINTRVRQVASFSQPQQDRYGYGFRIKLRDKDKEPTKAELEWIRSMQTLITRTGVTDSPRGREDFESFLTKLMWDSLVYDQMAFEVVPNRKGQPAEWYAVDAATIRLADSATLVENRSDTEQTRYVQIYDGMVIAEFGQNEMCFGVRNPRTDIRLFGYGVSELEMLISTVTSLLWGFEYNQRFFSQGSSPKGIINFKGAIPERRLQQFRRHWYKMCSGVENAWRTPITASDEMQYHDLQQSNRDMEFNAWIDFLIKVACSMYQMNPVEVNFQYGNTGQNQAMGEERNREKITESRERGLRPLLTFIARKINQYILWPINENFEFEFVGLDTLTREESANLAQTRGKTTMTVDELRAEDDLRPLPDGKGEVVLDPTWIQWAQQKEAAAAEEAEGPGGPSDGGDSDDDFDFESLLAQYEGDEDEGEADDEGGDEDQTEKSMRRIVVDLDL